MAKRASARRPYQRLPIAFLGAVAVLALFVLLLSLARVRVVITPRAETLAADTTITVLGSGPVSGDAILGRLVRVDGTADARVPVGASAAVAEPNAPVPLVRAKGTVTLVSTLGTAQPLVATTRLLSSEGVLFRMEKGATVPARGRLAGVAVYADAAGSQGNIGPSKFTIPGLSKWLQERVWAESTEPMTGGSGVAPQGSAVAAAPPPVVVTERDLDLVRERARAAAREDANERALALARVGEELVVLDESTTVTTVGATGERRAQVEARAAVTLTGVLIEQGAILARARSALEERAATSGRTLHRVRPETLRTRIRTQDAALARVTITAHLEGDVVLPMGRQSFEPKRIAGFTPEGVETYLRALPGVGAVEVDLWPFWVRRVPQNVGTVEVEVRPPS